MTTTHQGLVWRQTDLKDGFVPSLVCLEMVWRKREGFSSPNDLAVVKEGSTVICNADHVIVKQ